MGTLKKKIYTDKVEYQKALKAYNDSLLGYNSTLSNLKKTNSTIDDGFVPYNKTSDNRHYGTDWDTNVKNKQNCKDCATGVSFFDTYFKNTNNDDYYSFRNIEPVGSNSKDVDIYEKPKTMPVYQNPNERQYTAAKYLGLKGKPTGYVNEGNNQGRVELKAKGGLLKRADGSYSQRGLWDNIRANKGSGKQPTAEMLKQERKIKASYAKGGTLDLPGIPKSQQEAEAMIASGQLKLNDPNQHYTPRFPKYNPNKPLARGNVEESISPLDFINVGKIGTAGVNSLMRGFVKPQTPKVVMDAVEGINPNVWRLKDIINKADKGSLYARPAVIKETPNKFLNTIDDFGQMLPDKVRMKKQGGWLDNLK